MNGCFPYESADFHTLQNYTANFTTVPLIFIATPSDDCLTIGLGPDHL